MVGQESTDQVLNCAILNIVWGGRRFVGPRVRFGSSNHVKEEAFCVDSTPGQRFNIGGASQFCKSIFGFACLENLGIGLCECHNFAWRHCQYEIS